MRFWDAVFGAVAFLYVFAIGRRLAGPVCGVSRSWSCSSTTRCSSSTACAATTWKRRSFLCYCGGMYHYIALGRAMPTSGAGGGTRSAVALYFFLGFMTKFVAALFLPVMLAATTALLPAARQRLVADFSPGSGCGLVFALAAPWFVYQQFGSGKSVWRIIFGAHVFERFTSSLDLSHVHPWNYYCVETSGRARAYGDRLARVGRYHPARVVRRAERRVEAVAVLPGRPSRSP